MQIVGTFLILKFFTAPGYLIKHMISDNYMIKTVHHPSPAVQKQQHASFRNEINLWYAQKNRLPCLPFPL